MFLFVGWKRLHKAESDEYSDRCWALSRRISKRTTNSVGSNEID